MRIKQLKIKDFGRFIGTHTLEFSPENSLTIVHADNMVGKSTLYYAMGWIFNPNYEVIKDGASKVFRSKAPWYYTNHQTEERDITAMAELIFEHRGVEYRVKREEIFYKENNGERWKVPGEDRSSVICKRSFPGSTEESTTLEEVVSSLPPNLLKYCQFDGDYSLKGYYQDERLLKGIVYDLTNIASGEKAQSMVEKAQQNLNNEIGKEITDDEITTARNAVQQYDQRIKTQKGTADRLTGQLSAMNEQIESLEKTKGDNEQVNEVVNARKRMIASKAKIEGARALAVELIRNSTEAFPQIIVGNMPKIDESISEIKGRGNIPTNIRYEYVSFLQDEKTCICGRPVEKDTPEFDYLEAEKSKENDAVTDLLSGLGGAVKKSKEAGKEKKREFLDAIKTWKSAILTSKKDEDSYERLKEGTPEYNEELATDPSAVIRQLGILYSEKSNVEGDLRDAETALSESRSARSERQSALERLLSATGQDKKQLRTLKVVSDALNILGEAIEELKSQCIEEIVSSADKYKNELFAGYTQDFQFAITENWKLHITGEAYSDDNEWFSEGQSMLASYCVVLAVAEITGVGGDSENGLPFVIDNPFSKLMSVFRQDVLGKFSEVFHQAIVFAHDGDLNEQETNDFLKSGAVCQQFQIVPDPESIQDSNIVIEGSPNWDPKFRKLQK
jgi:DNA sulfur modification protein DndD